MKVCAVIPAHNEPSIANTVRACLQFGDVIVADDSSVDATASIARAAGARVVPVPPSRHGLSGVYRHGLLAALTVTDADWIWEVDAGGSQNPLEFARFLPWLASPGVVFGRRFGDQAVYAGPLVRRALSWGGTLATNLRFGSSFADATSGFICYHRTFLPTTHSDPFVAAGHYYQTEVRRRVLVAGIPWNEVPISFRTTKSSLRWRAVWEAATMALR